MTPKKPTKRQAKSKLRELEDDTVTTADVDVNIHTVGMDRAEDDDRPDSVVITLPGVCDVDGCDEAALVDKERCPVHYNGDHADG